MRTAGSRVQCAQLSVSSANPLAGLQKKSKLFFSDQRMNQVSEDGGDERKEVDFLKLQAMLKQQKEKVGGRTVAMIMTGHDHDHDH